jgi:hypothetical protein
MTRRYFLVMAMLKEYFQHLQYQKLKNPGHLHLTRRQTLLRFR